MRGMGLAEAGHFTGPAEVAIREVSWPWVLLLKALHPLWRLVLELLRSLLPQRDPVT